MLLLENIGQVKFCIIWDLLNTADLSWYVETPLLEEDLVALSHAWSISYTTLTRSGSSEW